jgi:hypothetical protein
MLEKRRFLRIPLSVPIEFRRIGYAIDENNVSRDLSVEGVRFLSNRFVPVASYIKVQLYVRENDEAVKFIAKVTWIKSLYDDELFEIGAHIWDISKEDSSFLKSNINL